MGVCVQAPCTTPQSQRYRPSLPSSPGSWDLIEVWKAVWLLSSYRCTPGQYAVQIKTKMYRWSVGVFLKSQLWSHHYISKENVNCSYILLNITVKNKDPYVWYGRQRAPPALSLAEAFGHTVVKMPALLLHGYPCRAVPLEHRWATKAGQGRGKGSFWNVSRSFVQLSLPSSSGALHKTTRTLMRPWICCHSLEKTWLGV